MNVPARTADLRQLFVRIRCSATATTQRAIPKIWLHLRNYGKFGVNGALLESQKSSVFTLVQSLGCQTDVARYILRKLPICVLDCSAAFQFNRPLDHADDRTSAVRHRNAKLAFKLLERQIV